MSEISHQKAHALLQVAADGPLGAVEKSALDAHLAKCKECSDYAQELTGLETGLRKIFHTQWDMQRPNLNLQAIAHPSLAKLIWNNFLGQTNAMGKVTIVATLVLGYIVIANLFGIKLPISDETPTTVPTPSELSLALAISPTPSAQFSPTGATTQACETFIYIVQENDTLAYIALQHGTTEDALMASNNLNSNTVFTGMELVIPLCKSTPPSQTATTTNTSSNGTIFPTKPE